MLGMRFFSLWVGRHFERLLARKRSFREFRRCACKAYQGQMSRRILTGNEASHSNYFAAAKMGYGLWRIYYGICSNANANLGIIFSMICQRVFVSWWTHSVSRWKSSVKVGWKCFNIKIFICFDQYIFIIYTIRLNDSIQWFHRIHSTTKRGCGR